MTWRLHLSNQAIQYINILPGKPSLVAAWTQRTRVSYFDLESGAQMGERVLKDVRFENLRDENWREFISTLIAPNKAFLSFIRTPQAEILTSEDGRIRLYYTGQANLILEIGDKESKLDVAKTTNIRAIALDRFLGLIAALDENAVLHLYQQQVPVGTFETGLSLDDDQSPQIAISHGGGSIFVTDGQRIMMMDSQGRTRKRLETHYLIGKFDCSPNGQHLVISDRETNVIRVYSGANLTPTHQRHAIDLLAEADQLQLIADFPPANVALNALAINNKGVLIFALAGVICASDITYMDALPQKTP